MPDFYETSRFFRTPFSDRFSLKSSYKSAKIIKIVISLIKLKPGLEGKTFLNFVAKVSNSYSFLKF